MSSPGGRPPRAESSWSAATSRAVVYGPKRELDAKGKSTPVSAWEARAVAVEPAVRESEFSAPLIGREEEITLLEMVAARGRRERVPQLVTLFGPAGVGKSRLVSELLARLPAARLLKGRCLPYGEGITYWPLAEAAKGDADILDTDPAGRRSRSSAAPLTLQSSRARARSSTRSPGRLASQETTRRCPRWTRRPSAKRWRTAGSATWGRSAAAASPSSSSRTSTGPPPALPDLVEHLVDRISDACVLLVCTARPEFLAEHPSSGAGKQNATALSLTPLTAEESERLVSNLLGEARVPDGVRKPLLSSAEGNPFFLEEMLQMLIDEGALERENGGWAATRRLAELRIPDSVHGVIAARLDLLDVEAREALRRCAVVGRVFWPSAVGVDEELVAGLTGTGLVSLQPVSVMAGLREFTFKHALTRDVAYGSLARSERKELHLQVADWIQNVAPGRDVETAELAAYHLREAIHYGEDDPEILHHAYGVLMTAGERALRRAALGAAQEHLEAAYELGSSPNEKGTALITLAEATLWTGRTENALQWLDKADALKGLDDPLRSDALAWRSRVSWLTGRWAEALRASDAAVGALEGLPESPQLARALARRSQIEMLRNRPEAAEHSREAIAVAERVGDSFAEINARINLFTVLASSDGVPPDSTEVLAIVERAAAIGALEEASRAVVNFIWSALGYLHVDEIEATARAGLDGRPPPPSITNYVDLSIVAKLLVPAGRWAEADAMLDGLDPVQMTATADLVRKPTIGTLAYRRGDLHAAGRWLADVRELALGSGEAQRIVPMACAVFPWLYLSGQTDELGEATDEIFAAVGDQWPVVLTTDPIARTLATAGDTDRLLTFAQSLAAAVAPKVGWMANNLAVAEGLVALADGRPGEAAEMLGAAAAEERRLGFAFDGACIALDHARALDADGRAEEAARVRAEAEEFFWALDCVNAL